jgi:predicted metalloenzyme YecM
LGNRKKNPWPNEQFDEVDWEHLELAMKTKPDMYKIWRSKQNSGFCRTRVQVGRYSGMSGQDERCPGRCPSRKPIST